MSTTQKYSAATPATDILECGDGFHIFVDLPGVSSSGLSIDLEENELTVKGVSSYSPAVSAQGSLRLEFETPIFERTFTLSDMVDRECIKANLKDGVLDLYLPKAEAMKPRRIEIKTQE